MNRLSILVFAAFSILFFFNVQTMFGQDALGLDHSRAFTQYASQNWQSEQGLPENSVLNLCQTRDGYLWIGTGEGLVRFDGVKFTVFDKKNTPAFTRHSIRGLAEDDNGNLWIGTRGGGLVRYSNGVFSTLTTKDGLPSNTIMSIAKARNNRGMWIGSYGGLTLIRDGKCTTYNTSNGLAGKVVLAILESEQQGDNRDVVWVGTEGGLSRFKNGIFTNYTTKDGLRNNSIRSLYEPRCSGLQGALWIGTRLGLNILKDGKITSIGDDEATFDGPIYAIVEPKNIQLADNILWIGSINGISRYTNGQWSHYTTKQGLANDAVITMLEDREGSLWVGTNGGGVTRFWSGVFTGYSVYDGVADKYVLPVYETRRLDGHIRAVWIGTDDGLSRLKDGMVTNYTVKDGLVHNKIFSLYEGSAEGSYRNTFWIGSSGGLTMFKNGKFTTYTTKDGLAFDLVSTIVESKDTGTNAGVLWLGTQGGGFSKLQNGTFTNYSVKEGLVNIIVRAMLEDREGTLWIGTDGGLSCFKDGKFTNYTSKEGLPVDGVSSLYEDADGTLWIGTAGGGLCRFHDGRFPVITDKNGMFDNLAYCIVEDDYGFFWLTCHKGIYRVSRKELNDFFAGKIERVSCTSFGTAEGMKRVQCNGGYQYSGWKDAQGNLWFATADGAVTVNPNPKNFHKNPVIPNVIIESIQADTTSLLAQNNVVLAAGVEKFEFQYTATCLFASERVRFKYILEGYDKDWIDAGSRRTAYYNNLPRGRNYRFRVIACNNDGIWNETGAWREFSIAPFWWETWWFYGLCAVFVSGGAYQGFRWRTSRLRAKAEELERIVDARTAELQDANAEISRQMEIQSEQAREIEIANTVLQEKNLEITASRERLEIMSEVGRSLTASLAIETIITNLYQRVSEVMDATVFGIGLIRYERNVIENKLVMDSGKRLPPYERNLLDKNQFAVWCVENAATIFINNVDNEGTRFIPSFREKINVVNTEHNNYAKSMLYVPLMLQGKPIGIISVQSYERNAYTEAQMEMLQTLAIANAESTEEIIRQKAIVEEFNRNIQDSIRYAKRIQDAMLPSTETLNRLLPQHFIFFRPKDVVSGDFYWCKQVRGLVFVAAVDCTGHGVPGAFMSLIGNSLLNDISARLLDLHPDLILNELHRELQTVLRQKETNNDDGMDICLCMIDLDTRVVEFAGAMNPLYAVVAGELREWKGTPEELGGREERNPVYARHVVDLSDVPDGEAMLYLTTDGYKDQYNDVRQRFMPKRLRPLLKEIAGKPLSEQPRLLGEAIDAHRGGMFQVDDMLVVGVRL